MDAAIQAHLAAGRHARAFDLIVPEFRDRVFRLSFSILRDRAAAEDATQETLVRVWKALPGFDGRAALGTWIYAIARNTCLMELRKRRPTVSFDDPDSTEAQHAADRDRDRARRGSGARQPAAAAGDAARQPAAGRALVLSRGPFLRRRRRRARHAARDGQEPVIPGTQTLDGACPPRRGPGRMNQTSHEHALSLGPCADYEFDLVEQSEGARRPRTGRTLQQHLAHCARCRAYAAGLARRSIRHWPTSCRGPRCRPGSTSSSRHESPGCSARPIGPRRWPLREREHEQLLRALGRGIGWRTVAECRGGRLGGRGCRAGARFVRAAVVAGLRPGARRLQRVHDVRDGAGPGCGGLRARLKRTGALRRCDLRRSSCRRRRRSTDP